MRYSITKRLTNQTIFLAVSLATVLSTGVALAFSTQWSTHFDGGNGDLNQWDRYKIGDCAGQNHSVSGSSVRMRAGYGTDCYGAFYRENATRPDTFPADQDVRVMWRWRYPEWGMYGTQAGQVTGRFGGPQYYGVSAVDTGNGDTDYAHVESNGPWGSWNVDDPMWRSGRRDSNWHTAVFDFICDGRDMSWWLDGSRFHQVTGGPALPPGHESRPYQFWFGNLITDVPGDGDWTNHDIDYVYIYAVERPQMNTPPPGSGGAQTVTWNAVPNTPQPGGGSWNVEYQVRACPDPNCSSVVATSTWQGDVAYTFNGLDVNRTYHYQARARWVGTPELVTCWGNTTSAQQVGVPQINLAKSATAAAGPGEVISYTLIAQNSGSAAAGGVVVRDPIPQHVVNPTGISDGGRVQGGEIVWDIGSLAVGESRALSWAGRVNLAVTPAVTQIVNVATASDDAGHSDEGQASTAVLVPGLALIKSAPVELKPGETFSYTLTVANTGNMTLPGVVVRDPVPPYVLDPQQISFGGASQGGEIGWDIGDMTPGESLWLTWQGRVDPLIPTGKREIANRATVTTDIGLTAEAEAASGILQPEMRVVKQASSPVMPGEIITYTLTLSNVGQTSLFQVHLEDPLPAWVTPVAHSISGNGYEVPGRIVWDNLGDIEPGSSRTVSWQGAVDPLVPPGVGQIRNVALATAGGGLTGEGEATSELLQPGLALSKDASATAYAGGQINYSLKVTNNGPGLARLVEVRDPLPAYTGFVPDVGPTINNYGTLEGSDVVWRLNELLPGQAATLRWRAQVNVDLPPGVEMIANEARAVSMDTPEPVLAQASTRLIDPGLSVSHTCPAFAQAGDVVAYQILVRNSAHGTARQVVVREPLPPGTTYLPGSATDGGQLVAGELVWALGTLAAGAQVELNFELQLDPDLTADNVTSTVTVSSADEADIGRSCQTGLVAPGLAVSKRGPETALANEVVEYALTVENTGPVMAWRAVLTDILPAGADYIPGTASAGGSVSEAGIVWQLGDLAPGEQVTRHYQVVVHAPQGVTPRQLYNEAVATAIRTQPVRASTTTIIPRPELRLTKNAPAEVAPGGTIVYRLSGGNDGPGLARQVVLRDSLPEGLVVLENSIGEDGYYDAAHHAVIWPLGHLAGGETVERDFEALVPLSIRPGSRSLDNMAFISSPDAASQYAYASTQITGTFIVAGQKQATPYAAPGESIEYAIQVHNGSPNVVANVVIRDPLPDYTTYLTGTASLPPAFADDGRSLVWNLGLLAAGETREVRFATRVAGEVPDWLDRVTNIARISYSGGSLEVRAVTLLPALIVMGEITPTPAPPTPTAAPPQPTPVGEPTATPLPTRPPVVGLPATPTPVALTAPVLSKTVWPAVVKAGQEMDVTWQLTFSNPTARPLGGVVVRDSLPDGLLYVSSKASQGTAEVTGSLSQTAVVAHLGDIPPQGQAEITIVTRVLSATLAGEYVNSGRYTALNVEPGVSNEARLVIEATAPQILPVTGGALDPRSPAGKLAWGSGSLLILLFIWLKKRWAHETR